MRRKRIGLRMFMFLSVAVIAAAAGGPADVSPAPPSARLAPLSWLAGSWRADFGGDQLDESWSAPSGDSMFGAFRWMKGGKAWMFEMLTIMDDGENVVLRIKHFDNKGVGWEEKTDAVTLRLVKQDADGCEFERINSPEKTRITYRKSGPDGVVVSLQKIEDGKPSNLEFTFRRIQ